MLQTDYDMDAATYILIGVLCLTILYFGWLVYLICKIRSGRAASRAESRLARYLAVSAGTDTEGKSKEAVTVSVETTHFYAPDGTEIDASQYDPFVVSGNSMSLCGIYDKDLLLVAKGFESSQLTDLPKIAVIKRRNAKPDEIQYKVRRAWKTCLITDDLQAVIREVLASAAFKKLQAAEECPDKDVLITDFFETRLKSYKTYYPDCDREQSDFHRIVISTTLHTDINEVRFSIHPLKDVKGIVAYSFTVPLPSA